MTNNAVKNDQEEQVEYVSIKFLLKQVYAAHFTKVKELESEIKTLKQELKDRQNTVPECQKCKEMEAAYSACKDEYKNAVLEQTRRLKELESKFSAIEDKRKKSMPDHEMPEVFDETRPHLMPDTFTESLNFLETEKSIDIDPKEKSVKPLRYLTSDSVAFNSIENTSETPLYSLKADAGKKSQNLSSKSKNFLLSGRKSSAGSMEDGVLIPETVELTCSPIQSNSNTSPKTKGNGGKENKVVESANEKSSVSKKRAFSDGTSHVVKSSKPCRKSEDNSAGVNTSPTSIPPTPAITSTKRKKLEKDQTGWSTNLKDLSSSSRCSTSSLVIAADQSKRGADLVTSDDDFQSSDPVPDESRSWKTSNKKALQKKQLTIKGIKTTSSFKMTIEPSYENFKKPNYKQTKLPMSTFRSSQKNNTGSIASAQTAQLEDAIPRKEAAVAECSGADAPLNETSFACLSELASLANGDTTHIQDSLLLMRRKSKDTALDESKTFCQIEIDFDEKDEDDGGCEEDIFAVDDVAPVEDHHKNENNEENICDSFDRVPAAEEPNYKYKEEAVRGRAKRKQLKAFECQECEKYYNELGLSEEEKKERLKQCSKHRAKYIPPSTPEHFWELDFPDTEESKARGYQAETQKVQLKTRRRRPLE